jgi:hypothetical protein
MRAQTTTRLVRALDAFAGSLAPGDEPGAALAQQILLRHPQAAVAWADTAAGWFTDARERLVDSEAP